MNEKSIAGFLTEHAALEPVSFHMPGHKGSRIYRKYGYGDFIENLVDYDITEIPGADNLFQTEGIIESAAEKYRKLYGVRKSYLLINGTSGGLIAAILASVNKGGRLIMARNCHKSVFNALTLGDIEPVYAYPSEIEEYGISGAVEADEIKCLLTENPDAEAVILPSPNYYGICSDIESISRVVHEAGKILIVDQAHGAHLSLFGKYSSGSMPPAAEDCGADIVVNSTHKTLLSFTQSAVLNVVSDSVDLLRLEDRLQAVESTSPSYILMASLDINADILSAHGREITGSWADAIEYFYEKAPEIRGLKVMTVPGRMDRTKMNIDMSGAGLNGAQMEELLMGYGIFSELTTGNILMCMTGAGNTLSDTERLLTALKEISEKQKTAGRAAGHTESSSHKSSLWSLKRELREVPMQKEQVRLEDCAGRVCASAIIPYPPGIPLICPGEVITEEDISYIRALRASGERVIGIDRKWLALVGKY